jgi:hypothetical protein
MSATVVATEQMVLTGNNVELLPLQAEHATRLLQAAEDGELWNMKVTVIPGPETVDAYVGTALAGRQLAPSCPSLSCGATRADGRQHAFLEDRPQEPQAGNRPHLVRASRVRRRSSEHRGEVPDARHAFEELRCVRVQLTTDEINAKSRAAILRLGAKQEGVVRNERIMPDGRKRNSVRFSIIDDEWPEVKAMLLEKMSRVL